MARAKRQHCETSSRVVNIFIHLYRIKYMTSWVPKYNTVNCFKTMTSWYNNVTDNIKRWLNVISESNYDILLCCYIWWYIGISFIGSSQAHHHKLHNSRWIPLLYSSTFRLLCLYLHLLLIILDFFLLIQIVLSAVLTVRGISKGISA